MFIDEIVLTCQAGRGGNGCVSFHREKYVARGGPDGGDGGAGGDIVLVACEDVHGFYELRGRRVVKAPSGVQGTSSNCHGKNAEDLVLRVPAGTSVTDYETGLVLKDLTEVGAEVRVAKGGQGGRGNARFARSTRQTPRYAEDGREGTRRKLRLELRMMADVGLVGLPNAGKSTLLGALSHSRTKTAGYQFTTLGPHLGVVELSPSERLTFADLPGLVEGAHEGKGLGDRFLRHVERTKVLVHIVAHDPTGASPPPAEAYRTIREELLSYSEGVAQKAEVVALSKCDLPGWHESLNSLAAESDAQVSPFSAVTGAGVRELLARVATVLRAQE